MTVSEELTWRGLIKDKTFDDVGWLDAPRTFYLGSDCSSDSLQIGNLAIYMVAKHLQRAGWKVVLLVGGATSLIGDPGGKSEERQLKSREEIEHNVAAIQTQVSKLFGGKEFTLVNNYDWFKGIGFLEFLRDAGKHYSMTELIQRDFIRERMGEGGTGISYAEFSYTMIQGYDFWHLYKKYGVELQIGGSDQWGNMLSGVPLIRKKETAEVHAFSMPLVLNKATGKKFGKSETGAIWLDPAKTTPTQFYQFWINVGDDGVGEYLNIYTMLSKAEIEAILVKHAENPRDRSAQKRLAEEVTRLVHGDTELVIAQRVTATLIGSTSVADLDEAGLAAMRAEIAHTTVESGAAMLDVLVATGLAASKSEARRLLQSNAISQNGDKTIKETLDADDFLNGQLLLRKGKAFKDSALVELTV